VQTALSEIRSPDTVSASFSFLVTNHFPLPPFPLSLFRSVVLCPLIAVNRAKETKTTCATCFCSTSVPFIHFISIPSIFSGSFDSKGKVLISHFSFLVSRFSFPIFRLFTHVQSLTSGHCHLLHRFHYRRCLSITIYWEP
jgi:hypothetical protein